MFLLWPPAAASKIGEGLFDLAKQGWELLAWMIERLWGVAIFNTFVGAFALFVIFGGAYYLRVRKRRFLVIAPFRIWSEPLSPFLGEGLATRLRDEVARLHLDVLRFEDYRARVLRAQPSGIRPRFHDVSPPIPPQLSMQYAGISPEAMLSLLRRLCVREAMITGDLCRRGEELLLVARRSPGLGLWEVSAETRQEPLFQEALQELAVRIVLDVESGEKKSASARKESPVEVGGAIANALWLRQIEASERKDHDEALRQAKLALIAVPDHYIQRFNLGVAHADKEQFDEAIDAYSDALRLNRREDQREVLQYANALNNRGIAYAEKDDYGNAIADFQEAVKLAPGNPDFLQNLGDALGNAGRAEEAEEAYARTRAPRIPREAVQVVSLPRGWRARAIARVEKFFSSG